jgi:hypothetical protein
MNGGADQRAWLTWFAVTSASMLAVGGCADLEEASEAGYQPAVIEEIEGADVKQVSFVEDAARRVSLQTAVVQRGGGDRVVLPYAALVYDPAGQVWVYTVPKRLTFLRVPVTVDLITGNRVVLTSGPAVGTRVVTRGAAEVYGAELDIAGGH